MIPSRVVIWFSAGVTSAIAAKLTIEKYRDVLPVHLVTCDTGSEDEDNHRFGNDVAVWLDLPLEVIRNEKYIDTFAVYDASGFMMNQYGAKCTTELKKLPRRKYENLATDLQVFGYDADERHRAQRFAENNPEVTAWFPLIEAGITKDMARQILKEAGILEPITYSQGFKNANCLKRGCVKGGMGYWNRIRVDFPELFLEMARVERKVGATVLKKDGKRLYLDQLDPKAGRFKEDQPGDCGVLCQVALETVGLK
mgnify:CR=1 FL=1